MYSLLVIISKLFECVKQLQTRINTILNVCTHYLWLFCNLLQTCIITILNECQTTSNNYKKYIKFMYTLLVINIKWFKSVDLLRTITITLFNVCTHYYNCMYASLVINIKWFKRVEQLQTIIISVLNPCKHYMWFISNSSKESNNFKKVKCTYI